MASPVRRALAPLDANKQGPSPPPSSFKSPRKHLAPTPSLLSRPPMVQRSPARERKRSLDAVEERAPKKARGEASAAYIMPNVARASASPDASPVPDTPDTTQTSSTTAAERDSLRRAQARKMAGDLVARLRLAKYKVRTGQAHVPFPQLEARVPRVEVRGVPLPARPEDAATVARTKDSGVRWGVERTETAPALSSTPPRRCIREERHMSSVRMGGAASGLLRLSQGTS